MAVPQAAALQESVEPVEARFAALYPLCRAQLLRYVIRNVSARDAEEITDEALSRAFEALPRLNVDQPLGPWLRVVARRLARDLHRARQRCDSWTDVYQALEPVPARDLDPEQVAMDAERQRRLASLLSATLSGVPAGQRRVLWMRAVDEMPFSEIAGRLGSTEAAVRQQLSKACRRLRAQLTSEGDWVPAVLPAGVLQLVRVIGRGRRKLRKPVHAGHLAAAALTAATVATAGLAIVGGGPKVAPDLGSARTSAVKASAPLSPAPAAGRPTSVARVVNPRRSGSTVQQPVNGPGAVPQSLAWVRLAHGGNAHPLQPGTQAYIEASVRTPVGTVVYKTTLWQPAPGKRPVCSLPGVRCG